MRQNDTKKSQEHRDFFISYTGSDRQWAEWIAFQLEQAGYTLFIQAWDFRPGSNFVAEMDKAAKSAERTLLVLSPAYLESDVAFSEWATAFRRDPRGVHRSLLPVRITPCEVDGLLGQVVYVDLVSLEETQARERLLAEVQQERAKPDMIAFPGQHIPYVPFPGALPAIWNIPYPRNPYFLGRDILFEQISRHMQAGQATALSQPQAISGLGGIGKTQIAVEYAYQFRQEYEAVLWVRAESQETLTASYGELARLLLLPEREAQDQEQVIAAVKAWLQLHHLWLLILDNADELGLLPPFLPPASSGHVLLTTRAWDMQRLAQRVEVDSWPIEVGAHFLLRRAGRLPLDALLGQAKSLERARACQISEQMGGLPLALDQAGAYLEATDMSLEDYQQVYQQHRRHLHQRRGALVPDHPEPVATTWALSFARVKQQNRAAAALLQLCAFLSPDAIPEEVLIKGAKYLGSVIAPVVANPLRFGQAIEALRRHSLIRRDPATRTLALHRMVQAVVTDEMDAATRKRWIERVIHLLQGQLPSDEVAEWPRWEQLVGQITVALTWLTKERMTVIGISELFRRTGWYLSERARYREAEQLLEKALEQSQREHGKAHPVTGITLHTLAVLYQDQGKYEEAEPLYQRALRIHEQALGPEHPETARTLHELARLYQDQGKYEEVEPLYQRALRIREQALGPEHPDTASTLYELARLYNNQGKYEEAEPLCQRALHIHEQALGLEHPYTATILNLLARISQGQGKYIEAEALFLSSVHMYEQALGPEHPGTATIRFRLAQLYEAQKRYEKAEPLYQHALRVREQTLGSQHPLTLQTRKSYASLLRTTGRVEEARQLDAP